MIGTAGEGGQARRPFETCSTSPWQVVEDMMKAAALAAFRADGEGSSESEEPSRDRRRLILLMSGYINDQTLIAACRAGETGAYGLLVRRYQDRLYPTVLRLTGCAEDAQDLLQETFLRGYQKLSKFHGESSFYTWIYRIAVNLALSGRRRKRIVASLDVGPRDGFSADPVVDPGETDPTLPLERAERDQIIHEALQALAPDHRAVVVMKEFDGLRYEEIGAILNVPVGTVRSRLHRARCELRERLSSLVDEAVPARHAAGL
jgi:RNA polymerase sigma-70 factor, ECF subfamily